MSTLEFNDIADFWKQGTDRVGRELFENEAPTYGAFKKNVDIQPVSGKGWKIPLTLQRPGGGTWFTPTQPDFNAAVPMKSIAMWVYATHFALPIQLGGEVIRSFKTGGSDALSSMGDTLESYNRTAAKIIEWMLQGDGTGSLAYSATNLTAPGPGQTLTCTTTAGATVAGQTKGGVRLNLGQTYQAINTTTGNPRGAFRVTTINPTAPVVNLLSGTVNSGDPIVMVGSYQRALRGLAHLISNVNRDLQGQYTGDITDLNSYFLDLQNVSITPGAFSNLKAGLKVRNNKLSSAGSLSGSITPGQMEVLARQGYNYRNDPTFGKQKVQGVAPGYEDGDTMFVEASDADEDRTYLWKNEQLKMFEEMPFGEYDLDGQQLRMQLGANSAGSDVYQKAIGICTNPGIMLPRSAAGLRRAKISGVVTQVTAGAT